MKISAQENHKSTESLRLYTSNIEYVMFLKAKGMFDIVILI